jgi:hypothetical protein
MPARTAPPSTIPCVERTFDTVEEPRMQLIETNAELEAFHLAGRGLVFNDFTAGPSGAKFNVLHTASCNWVKRMLKGADPHATPSVPKVVFDSVDEAESWLTANRGPEGQSWKRCGTCHAGRQSIPSSNTAVTAQPPFAPMSAHRTASTKPSNVASQSVPSAWPSPPTPAAFAIPQNQSLRLPIPPRLASWDKSDDPAQVKLREYLDVAEDLLRPQCETLVGPLSLRLDVGLPSNIDLLEHRDLDNYLFPLATRLRKRLGNGLVSVWGTKQHAPGSNVRVDRAVAVAPTRPFDDVHSVHTDAPGESTAFKGQIRDQLACDEPLPMGPVHLELSFVVGPQRNWLNLWKPTIDALGQILGHAPGATEWNPLDGRIVTLGLHNRVDPTVGKHVFIAIAAEHLQP